MGHETLLVIFGIWLVIITLCSAILTTSVLEHTQLPLLLSPFFELIISYTIEMVEKAAQAVSSTVTYCLLCYSELTTS